MKELYVAHVDTTYCGTEDYLIFTATNEMDADIYAQELAYENASQFFEVVDDETLEDYEENLGEDFDASNYLLEEDISYDIEEYDPVIHNDYLNIIDIDLAREELEGMK